MATFTVFCQDADGGGTVWIEAVEAPSAEEAERVGREACAEAWERDDATDVHVLGVAAGQVEILLWDDLGEN